MTSWYLWLTPLAVGAIIALLGFVGCQLVFPLDDVDIGDFTVYDETVLADSPVMYLRLQESSPGTVIPGGEAVDLAGGNHPGVYERLGNALPDDPATLSPAAGPPLLEIGIAPALLPPESLTTAIRVRAARVRVPFSAAINPAQFTFEVFVQPEWDLSVLGRYYAVVENTDKPPTGSTNSKQKGFAIYAGPESPGNPQTPYRWQLWVGSGTDFRQLVEQPPVDPSNPGPLVEAAPTYLGVTCDGSEYQLFAYNDGRDIDAVKYRLVPQPYVPNTNGDMTIGMTQASRSLVPPFPGPANRNLYPFIGKMQEVALYDQVLTEARIVSHITTAFYGG